MNGVREFLLNNLGLKALSLLLAVVMWFQIAGQDTIQRTLSLPVEFVNIPSQLEISNAYQREVDVVVRARDATNLDPRILSVVLDLRGAGPGEERSFPLSEENIKNRPSGMDVLGFSPARIRLQLEQTIRKRIEVNPLLTGEPVEGFEVIGIQASPVNVSGPKSRVDQVTEARTVPINVDGLSSTLMTDATVDTEDPSLRLDPASASVVVVIEEKRREVAIREVAVRSVPESAPVSLLTKNVDIVGTVPVSFVEELRAEVNVRSLTPQQEPHQLLPQVSVVQPYAGFFRLISVSPERVRVRRDR